MWAALVYLYLFLTCASSLLQIQDAYVDPYASKGPPEVVQMDFRNVLLRKQSTESVVSDSLPESTPGGYHKSPVATSAGDQTVLESKRTESFTSKRMSSTTEVCTVVLKTAFSCRILRLEKCCSKQWAN